QLAHLGEETQARIARQAVGPETDVEAEASDERQLECLVAKIAVASRAMSDMAFCFRCRERFEVALQNRIEMGDDPSAVERTRAQHVLHRRLAIVFEQIDA